MEYLGFDPNWRQTLTEYAQSALFETLVRDYFVERQPVWAAIPPVETPTLVIITGLPGAGGSELARSLKESYVVV